MHLLHLVEVIVPLDDRSTVGGQVRLVRALATVVYRDDKREQEYSTISVVRMHSNRDKEIKDAAGVRYAKAFFTMWLCGM